MKNDMMKKLCKHALVVTLFGILFLLSAFVIYVNSVVKDHTHRYLRCYFYRDKLGYFMQHQKLLRMPVTTRDIEVELNELFGDDCSNDCYVKYCMRDYYTIEHVQLYEMCSPKFLGTCEYRFIVLEFVNKHGTKMLASVESDNVDIYLLISFAEKSNMTDLIRGKDTVLNENSWKYLKLVLEDTGDTEVSLGQVLGIINSAMKHPNNFHFARSIFNALASSKKWEIQGSLFEDFRNFYGRLSHFFSWDIGLRIGLQWTNQLHYFYYNEEYCRWDFMPEASKDYICRQVDQEEALENIISKNYGHYSIQDVELYKVPVSLAANAPKVLVDSILFHAYVVVSFTEESQCEHNVHPHGHKGHKPQLHWLSLEKNGEAIVIQSSRHKNDVLKKFRGEYRLNPAFGEPDDEAKARMDMFGIKDHLNSDIQIKAVFGIAPGGDIQIKAVLDWSKYGYDYKAEGLLHDDDVVIPVDFNHYFDPEMIIKDGSRRSGRELHKFLVEWMQHERGYSVLDQNCQHFSKAVFDFLAKNKKWD